MFLPFSCLIIFRAILTSYSLRTWPWSYFSQVRRLIYSSKQHSSSWWLNPSTPLFTLFLGWTAQHLGHLKLLVLLLKEFVQSITFEYAFLPCSSVRKIFWEFYIGMFSTGNSYQALRIGHPSLGTFWFLCFKMTGLLPFGGLVFSYLLWTEGFTK